MSSILGFRLLMMPDLRADHAIEQSRVPGHNEDELVPYQNGDGMQEDKEGPYEHQTCRATGRGK